MNEQTTGPRARRGAARTAARKPASSSSLADRAYEVIKHKIIVLDYPPGEYLNEAQLSAALGIGRTPVHQAAARLMLEGMIEVIPRKGLIVKPVTLNEIKEIIEVRLINEPYAAQLAAQLASDDEIAELGRILDDAEAAAPQIDVEKQMLFDKAFHCAILAASRNTVLADLLKRLHERSLRFWFISLRNAEHHAEVIREHRMIYDAIRARDPEAAAKAIRSHIASFRHTISEQV